MGAMLLISAVIIFRLSYQSSTLRQLPSKLASLFMSQSEETTTTGPQKLVAGAGAYFSLVCTLNEIVTVLFIYVDDPPYIWDDAS